MHRLDVGTTGVMVVATVRARLHGAQARVQGAHGREALPRRRARATPTRPAARSTPRSTATRATTTSSPSSRADGRASPTTTRSRRSRPRRCSTSTWRPAAPTRSACTCRRCATRASATSPTAPTRCSRSGSGLTRQWLHARSLGFAHPADGRWVEFVSPYPADLARRAGSAARVTTRGRLALLAACGVVAALVALYTAVRAPAPTPRARPRGRCGSGRSRARPSPPTCARAAAHPAARRAPRRSALVQFADEQPVADVAALGHAHRGGVPRRPAARADRAALRRCSSRVPVATALDTARQRAASAADGRRGQAHGPRRRASRRPRPPR